MDVDLVRLGHLVAIAEFGSFSKAAEAKAITQPAISRSMATLEERLGIRIFDRVPGGVVPTRAGAALIADARRLLSHAQILEHNVAQWRDGAVGEISIGAGSGVGTLIFRRVFAALLQKSPKLKIRSVIAPYDAVVRGVLDKDIDFGLATPSYHEDDQRIRSTTLGTLPVGLFVAAGHPLAGIDGVSSSEIAAFPVGSGQWSQKSRVLGGLPSPTISCESHHVLADLMLSEGLIWIALEPLAARIAGGGAVKLRLAPDLRPPRYQIDLVELRDRPPFPAGRLLTKTIADALADEGCEPHG